MARRTGQCMCGAVKYAAEVNGPFSACFCKMCQRWASGMFAGVHTSGLEILNGEAVLTRFKSSDWAERGFCSTCGSNIYYHAAEHGHPSVALGTLDDTGGLARVVEYYTDLKPDGFARTDDTTTLTEAETIARFTGA